jgi:Ca-activated chloride channel family protein
MDRAGLFVKGGGAVPLLGVEIGGEVLGSHARIVVRQKYRNSEASAVEAVYTFPLSSEGALVGFRMSVNGRDIAGVVKEREEAFAAYDEAIASGHGAALLDQERPNVFTAQVGNLLPGEETVIEVEYLERVHADEGALRLMIPTLVAPRYIPGAAQGDRSAHGWAQPTDRVPDADRITPPLGDVAYGFSLDLAFDLGRELQIESPSHAITVKEVDGKAHVQLGGQPLDRDLVLIARGAEEATLTTVAVHRAGHFALTVVPDLLGKRPERQEVVFLIDISGSMGGASLVEAKAALKLCLRHLREGDRFNIIAFDDQIERFEKAPVPFKQKTLEAADRWVAALEARGGTEILAPLLEAAQQTPHGVIVLLTDGQVGNENEILEQVLAKRERARVYSFGIGTNVSDWMLRELGRRTGGAVELIHPGERIDEKVVAQFARAVAARVEEVRVEFSGVDVGEQAPATAPPLVDGEPWTLLGRVENGQSGRCTVRGKLEGKPFELEVPIDVRSAGDRPAVAKLWAKERIRDLEGASLSGRRQESMKQRIVKLAVDNQIVCSLTSFVVVETRTGDRRMNAQPETRVIPVNVPAGWDMFKQQQDVRTMTRCGTLSGAYLGAGAAAQYPPSPPAMAPSPAMAPPSMAKGGGILSKMVDALAGLAPTKKEAKKAATQSFRGRQDDGSDKMLDPVMTLLGSQLASGLWDEADAVGDDHQRRARATSRALLELVDLGVTSAHKLHGAQVKKAIEALLQILSKLDDKTAELALGAAWLAASGRRTRRELEDAMSRSAVSLRVWLADAQALRAHLVQLAV